MKLPGLKLLHEKLKLNYRGIFVRDGIFWTLKTGKYRDKNYPAILFIIFPACAGYTIEPPPLNGDPELYGEALS